MKIHILKLAMEGNSSNYGVIFNILQNKLKKGYKMDATLQILNKALHPKSNIHSLLTHTQLVVMTWTCQPGLWNRIFIIIFCFLFPPPLPLKTFFLNIYIYIFFIWVNFSGLWPTWREKEVRPQAQQYPLLRAHIFPHPNI